MPRRPLRAALVAMAAPAALAAALVLAAPAALVQTPEPGAGVPAAPPPAAPAAPAAPAPPAAPAAPAAPATVQLDLTPTPGASPISQPVTIVVLLALASLVPAMLILLTSFTRIVIVLGLTRNALGLNGIPPNQVLIGLALFLTLFVMAPVFSDLNREAVQPYLKGQLSQSEAYEAGMVPFREFMLDQTRERDLALFVRLSGKGRPSGPEDVPTSTLIPAFVISELRAAFLIGFVIFVPFLVVDMVTSATLMSMGMVMLPPVLISLPFKLLLFVVVDGWYLVVQSLVKSFAT